VAVTIGASGGFILTTLACFDVGARVGVCRPGYPAYRNMLAAFGVEPVSVPVGPDTRYVPTVDVLRSVGRLDGLVVASPSNPTGTALSEPGLAELIEHCDRSGLWLVSDEIYHGITFDRPAVTAAGRSERVVVVQSFSKYFSMTGWRVGWLVLPAGLIRPVERLAQNLFISPPAVSQVAARAALECTDELDRIVAGYAESRTVVLDALAAAGLGRVAPADGAFYVWVDVSEVCDDSADLARRWLDEIGVAVTPGIDFDPVDGARFIRISYSESTPDVAEAMARIEKWVSSGG
jgi:aspartate/methionine/tyrosine aminotransferase